MPLGVDAAGSPDTIESITGGKKKKHFRPCYSQPLAITAATSPKAETRLWDRSQRKMEKDERSRGREIQGLKNSDCRRS